MKKVLLGGGVAVLAAVAAFFVVRGLSSPSGDATSGAVVSGDAVSGSSSTNEGQSGEGLSDSAPPPAVAFDGPETLASETVEDRSSDAAATSDATATLTAAASPRSMSAVDRAKAFQNMQRLAFAMLDLENLYGFYPTAVPDPSLPESELLPNDMRSPLLSWRVRLLPLLGEEELFNQFDTLQPWDAPQNRALLDRMPAIYRPIWADEAGLPSGQTTYRLLTTEGSLWEQPMPSSNRLKDGLSNAILIVEGGRETAIEWTRPDLLTYESPTSLGSPPWSRDQPGWFVALFDGFPMWLPQSNAKDELLRPFVGGRTGLSIKTNPFADARR